MGQIFERCLAATRREARADEPRGRRRGFAAACGFCRAKAVVTSTSKPGSKTDEAVVPSRVFAVDGVLLSCPRTGR